MCLNPRVLVFVALTLAAGSTQADTTCAGAGTSLNFGAYDVFSPAPLDSATQFTVTCTRTGGPSSTSVEIALGPSATSGAIPNRQLGRAGGSDRLNYNLYSDAARLSVWGDISGSNTVSTTVRLHNNTTDSVSVTIFGRIFPDQDVHAGSYADSILITITY